MLTVILEYDTAGSYCIFQFGRLSQVEIQRRPELPDSIWKSSEHVIESNHGTFRCSELSIHIVIASVYQVSSVNL